MKRLSVTTEMKAIEQHFTVVLFVMLYKLVVLTFKFVDEILQCDHSNESCREILSCAVYSAVQGGSIF